MFTRTILNNKYILYIFSIFLCSFCIVYFIRSFREPIIIGFNAQSVQDVVPTAVPTQSSSLRATMEPSTTTEISTSPKSPSLDMVKNSILDMIQNDINNEIQLNKLTLSSSKLENNGRVTSLILAKWRTGSSFLGELLNSVPGDFYAFEPLAVFGDIVRQPNKVGQSIKDLIDISMCEFTTSNSYLKSFGRTNGVETRNRLMWKHCHAKATLCKDPTFMSQACEMFPFQTIKVVRLNFDKIEPLFSDDYNIKTVYLVRDPRAVMLSRIKCNLCDLDRGECARPEILCGNMIRDYMNIKRLKQYLNEKFIVIRFEDLMENLDMQVEHMFKFLDRPMTESVKNFIRSHTGRSTGGDFETYRVSKNVPFQWKNENYDLLQDIQYVCKDAMKLWGYKLVTNATQLKDDDFNPVTTYTLDDDVLTI